MHPPLAEQTWLPNQRQNLQEIWDSIDETNANSSANGVLKRSQETVILRLSLGGIACIAKIHAPRKLVDRFRPSKAHRAFRAAQLLIARDIPTPEPLALLSRKSPMPQTAFIYRDEPETQTCRDWIKPRMHHRPEAERRHIAEELLEALLSLYRAGLYHPDTKCGNLLVQDAETSARRTYLWIDLDGLVPAKQITQKMMTMNLVQLNGSIGTRITREDRMYFLQRFIESSAEHAWAKEPSVAAFIEAETHRRLLREVKGICRA